MVFDLSKKYCYYFNEICKIPHGSKNESQLSNWLVAFAQKHNLIYIQDHMFNVVIYKAATVGYENHQGVVIQAHMDMVCERIPESEHDFTKDPLELYVDGTFLRAKGTTLGADDCMGVAYMLAILDDNSLEHPFLECCFTTQEENGLFGAQALKHEYFKARQLINLDGAGEYKTYMSMAGGVQVKAQAKLVRDDFAGEGYEIVVDGLLGGGSAAMIDKERGNALKLLARVLKSFSAHELDIRICSLLGGEKAGIIANYAKAVISTNVKHEHLKQVIDQLQSEISLEYEFSDPDVLITLKKSMNENPMAFSKECTDNLLNFLVLIPNGVIRHNLTLDGNPPVTSSNVGTVDMSDEIATIGISVKSSIESDMDNLLAQIELAGTLCNMSVFTTTRYPGWRYDAVSPLRESIKEVFLGIYNRPINCLIGHGGNECGVFKKMFPEMDIITSGAIYGNIHTTNEYLDLESFDRSYLLLIELLKKL